MKISEKIVDEHPTWKVEGYRTQGCTDDIYYVQDYKDGVGLTIGEGETEEAAIADAEAYVAAFTNPKKLEFQGDPEFRTECNDWESEACFCCEEIGE